MNKVAHTLAALAALVLFSTQAFADAVIKDMKGDVRVGNNPALPQQQVKSGATVNTGPGAQAILLFDDQQQIVLNENTTFRITDYRYRQAAPKDDRAVFDLLRGALRFITGVVGGRNPNLVALRIPQATIGIRGTDFMVALVNPGFLSVTQGAIVSSNSAGAVVFGPGSIGTVASSTTLAVPISAGALPSGVAGAFSNLGAAAVGPAVSAAAAQNAAAAAGASTGAVAAAPTAGVGAVVAIGVGAAIVATAVDDGKATPAATHH
jgi:hypothetical protein